MINMLPRNYGEIHQEFAAIAMCIFFLLLSFDGLPNLIVTQALVAYIAFFVRPRIYGEEVLIGRYLRVVVLLFLHISSIHIIQMASGNKYAVEVNKFKDNE